MSKIQVNEIVNHFDNGAPDCPRGLTVTGVSTFSGNVSIGGTLSYEDVTNIDSVGIITARQGLDAPTDLVLRTGGTEQVRIDSSGRLLVGTSSGTYNIESASSGPLKLVNGSTYDLRFVEQNSLTNIYSYGSQDLAINTRYSNNIRFKTSDFERMRIDSAGNVGVGTMSPASALDVNGVIATNSAFYVYNATKDGLGIWYNPGGSGVNQLTARTNGSDRLTIDSAGKVGIGVLSPQALLHIKATTPEFILQPTANTQDGYITFDDANNSARGWLNYNYNTDTMVFAANGSERMRIDSAGRLLVGVTAGTSAGAGVVQFGEFGTVVSNGGSVVNGGTLDITIGTSNICYWSGFLYVNNIDAASGANKTQSTFSVFADNQNQVSTFTQIASSNGSAARSFTVTYVDNGIIRFTNTSGNTCNVAFGFCGGGINMG